MSEQSSEQKWAGGPECYKRELKLLGSRPFSAEETVKLCGDLKSFVIHCLVVFHPPPASVRSSYVGHGGRDPMKELSRVIEILENRRDGRALMGDLMTIRRLLHVLKVRIVSRWETVVQHSSPNPPPEDVRREFATILNKLESFLGTLSWIPSQYVVRQLKLPKVSRQESSTANQSQIPSLGTVDIDIHHNWVDFPASVMPDKADSPPDHESDLSTTELLHTIFSYRSKSIESLKEQAENILSNFRLPSRVQADFLESWDQAKCTQGAAQFSKT
jgi:hypothetical protein